METFEIFSAQYRVRWIRPLLKLTSSSYLERIDVRSWCITNFTQYFPFLTYNKIIDHAAAIEIRGVTIQLTDNGE